MPLSEHEERALREIERRLYEDDARFAARLSDREAVRRHAGRLRLAGVGFVLGFLSLFAITFHLAFGLAGFALMLTSVLVGAASIRKLGSGDPNAFVDHLRSSWSRRRND